MTARRPSLVTYAGNRRNQPAASSRPRPAATRRADGTERDVEDLPQTLDGLERSIEVLERRPKGTFRVSPLRQLPPPPAEPGRDEARPASRPPRTSEYRVSGCAALV